MLERQRFHSLIAGVAIITAMLFFAPTTQAQKIVCWKDKSGKIVGCGDRIPPEFRQNESQILDKRGITRETTVSAQEAERLRAEEKKKAALKAEEDHRRAEQRRQDSALINTYTAPKEIDVRRDRELQVVELQIQQLKASVKGAVDAHAAQKARYANFEKRGKVPDNVKEDLAQSAEEESRIKERIAEKEKDKERITVNYAQQKARFIELKGGAPATAGAKTAPTKK